VKKAILNILCLLFGFSICLAQISQTPYPAYACAKYGTAINASALTNYRIDGQKVTYRFRAKHTGSISSIRIYIMGRTYTRPQGGYGLGNGGTWKITLRNDNAADHTPSSAILTSLTRNMIGDSVNSPNTPFPLLTFNSSVRIDSNTLYHIVFENLDPDPLNNYTSVNTLTMWPLHALSPEQQFTPDLDWSSLYAGAPYTTWNIAPGNDTQTPIMEYYYTDGYSTGMGYMEVWSEAPQTISGSSSVREQFTVSGSNRTASGVNVWLRKVSGTGDLTVKLESGPGAIIAQNTISASSITTSYAWYRAVFSSNQILTAGQTYHITLSAPSGTVYDTYPIRKDAGYGFTSRAMFSDGYAQYTTNGTTWSTWASSQTATHGLDLSFYLAVSDNSPGTPLPIQIASFNGTVQGNTVSLGWKTATEVNSYMFEIERRTAAQWESIAQIPAGGTSNAPLEYKYMDSIKNVGSGNIFYRLKLIDNDGSFQYSSEVGVSVTTAVTTTAVPNIYALSQNFPNPFNPSTTINYQLQRAVRVSLKVYDLLGREVATLVNENKGPGSYSAIFDASRLASGTYIYRLLAGSFTETKKLVLLR
jgi:hypothetical protein